MNINPDNFSPTGILISYKNFNRSEFVTENESQSLKGTLSLIFQIDISNWCSKRSVTPDICILIPTGIWSVEVWLWKRLKLILLMHAKFLSIRDWTWHSFNLHWYSADAPDPDYHTGWAKPRCKYFVWKAKNNIIRFSKLMLFATIIPL